MKLFIDKNKSCVLDSVEVSTTTSSTGAYTFSGLAAGSYTVREVVPATYRATTTNPLTVTVSSGSTTSGHNFGDSQTVLISGTVFNDANGDKIDDSTEKGIAGVVVYLDFNNNGQLDSFELKTTTDASGNYKFIVPFGTYVVRQVKPTGKTQTTPSSSYSVNLSKGQTSTGRILATSERWHGRSPVLIFHLLHGRGTRTFCIGRLFDMSTSRGVLAARRFLTGRIAGRSRKRNEGEIFATDGAPIFTYKSNLILDRCSSVPHRWLTF